MSDLSHSHDFRSAMQALAQANPGLTHPYQHGAFPPPPPDESSHATPCDAQRIVQAGGLLAELIMHPSFVAFEHLFRRFPEDGMFEATPERPFNGDLGSLTVPGSMSFLLCDYRFDPYRLNGGAVGDFVPVERRRLSTMMSYDVNTNQFRKGNLEYHLDPEPFTATKEALYPGARGGTILPAARPNGNNVGGDGLPTTQSSFLQQVAQQTAGQGAFDIGQFTRTAVAAGPALSSLPQRHARQGAPSMPWTQIVPANETLMFSVQVFRKIPIPLAFIEVSFSGFLVPSNLLSDMLQGLKPCVSPGGGR